MPRSTSPHHLRSLRLALAPVLLLTAIACSGDSDATAPDAPAPDAAPAASPQPAAATPSATPAAAPSSPAPAAAPAAGGASSKPAPKLTSLDGGTVSAGDLHAAYFHWKDQTITVAGYPALTSKRGRWGSRVHLGAVGELETPKLVECKMASAPEGKLTPETTLVLRGTFKNRYFAVRDGEPPRVRLEDCELVSSGEALPESSDPWNLGPEPVLAQDLHAAALGWQGQTVRVSGYYKGSTHSSATDETSHALKSGASGSSAVLCNESGKTTAPEAVKQDRASAVVEGTLIEPSWSEVVLGDCRWVSG